MNALQKISATLMLLTVSVTASAVPVNDYPVLRELVEQMVREDNYPRAELEAVLTAARIDRNVIRLMDKQYEALPWHQYRERFVSDARINAGVKWWARHDAALQQAAREYGVAPAIIVALIGVETYFGTRLGGKRVLDSLVTLTAEYPRRRQFFRRELRAFLNTARAENILPETVIGSFAGAVGIPQFMPTSYQAYAVDLNQNGKQDLVTEHEDAIGSVANYLKRRGWKKGQTVFAPLPDGIPSAAKKLISKKSKPNLTAQQLNTAGVKFNAHGGGNKMALLKFREVDGQSYFIAFHNFHVITRYNPSVNYAMAVAQLSEQIDRRRNE